MKDRISAAKADKGALRDALRREIYEDELFDVVGDGRPGKLNESISWVCPYCGATVPINSYEGGPKHMTKCPNNPYK